MTQEPCASCVMCKGNRCMILEVEGQRKYIRDHYCPFRDKLGYAASGNVYDAGGVVKVGR